MTAETSHDVASLNSIIEQARDATFSMACMEPETRDDLRNIWLAIAALAEHAKTLDTNTENKP